MSPAPATRDAALSHPIGRLRDVAPTIGRDKAAAGQHTGAVRASVARTVGVQAMLIAVALLFYFAVRLLTAGGLGRASTNADQMVAVERSLGILWEPAMQNAVIDHKWLVTLANAFYVMGLWPLLAAVAVWLFARHREHFFVVRNAVFISGAIGLVLYASVPMLPPRLGVLPMTDTIMQRSEAYSSLQAAPLTNQYAAFPSLHVGFVLLAAIALVRAARRRIVRGLAMLIPIAMGLTVIVTANHYVLDVVFGVAVAVAGQCFAHRTRRVRATTHRDGAGAPSFALR